MTSDDLPAVSRIEMEVFPLPWSHSAFVAELDNPLAWVRVAVDDREEVVGYLIARFYGDIWHLMDLAVRPDRVRTGLGALLLDDLLEVVVRTGMDVTLEVRPTNAAAIALYRSRGFDEVGRRRGYYGDNGEDALVLVRRGVRQP